MLNCDFVGCDTEIWMAISEEPVASVVRVEELSISEERTNSSKLLFPIYQTSCRHIQEDSDVMIVCLSFSASM